MKQFIARSSSASNHLFYQPDLCFMASRVITGEAKAVVIRTGDKTFWGYMCLYKRRDSFICACLLRCSLYDIEIVNWFSLIRILSLLDFSL